MFTEKDERRGLVKVYWADIRKRVKKVEPEFAKIVDSLNPDKTFPVFLAYFPYGALQGDTISPFLPKVNQGFYRLSDSNIPDEIVKHLGYGKNSSPFGMVLEKEFEYFIDLKNEGITIPWAIYQPGRIFPFSRILSINNKKIYAPNGILTTTSGARSTFMLPNIGCLTNHINLQRDFNIQDSPPKQLYDHWNIFRQVVNSEIINSDWRACILYFSEKWVEKILNDKAWLNLKIYLHQTAWRETEFERNQFYYDIAYSLIKKKRNLKPNPYLADTARHLLATALGETPGYAPATHEEALPLSILQKIFVESYGLKKYLPSIMQPAVFNFEKDKYPIYYSLQNPSTYIFSPKSREVSSTLFEMRELEHILRIFITELASPTGICSDSIIYKMLNEIKFAFFHNKHDRHNIVKNSEEIIKLDKRFTQTSHKKNKAKFSADAPFLRGCISIARNKL